MDNEILFTPAALLDFLSQIDELSDKDIALDDTGASLTIKIGDSTYSINNSDAEDIEVTPEVVNEVSDINESTLEEIEDIEFTEVGDEEVVEGGLVKEFFKTLAVGGMVRLTTKMLGKDAADAILKK